VVRRITSTEAKAKLLALLDRVAAGDEVEITKHGRPVARLVPASGGRTLKGRMAGVAATVAEGDELYGTGVHWNSG